MTVQVRTVGSGFLAIDIVGVASEVAAAQGVVANPEGCDLHIIRAYLLTKTAAVAAGLLSVGVTTVAAAATDVLNALDVNAATEGVITNSHAHAGAKTELVPAVWTAAKYLTFSGTVASMVGFTGTLYVEYIRA